MTDQISLVLISHLGWEGDGREAGPERYSQENRVHLYGLAGKDKKISRNLKGTMYTLKYIIDLVFFSFGLGLVLC